MFITFGDFVEREYGYATLDSILLKHTYPNQGGFSIAQDYCPSLLKQVVEDLSEARNTSIEDTWYDFGLFAFSNLYQRFARIYQNTHNPIFSTTLFDFLEQLNVIHLDELRKLYPHADFPRFEIYRTPNDERLTLIYSSKLQLNDFARGLLQGCINHFGESVILTHSMLNENAKTKFILSRH